MHRHGHENKVHWKKLFVLVLNLTDSVKDIGLQGGVGGGHWGQKPPPIQTKKLLFSGKIFSSFGKYYIKICGKSATPPDWKWFPMLWFTAEFIRSNSQGHL